MKTNLTERQRDDVASLLEDHSKVCETIKCIGKAGWSGRIFLCNEDGDENVDAHLDNIIARAALQEQKRLIEEKLGRLGIKIGRK